MPSKIWGVLIGIFTVLMVIGNASSAFANRGISVEPTVFSVLSPELIFQESGAEAAFTCSVLRVFSLHRTIAKVEGTLAGYVTAVRFLPENGECRGGRIRILSTPWHLKYKSFEGRLPNPSRVRLQVSGFAFLIDFLFFGRCLYRGSAAGGELEDFVNLAAEGRVTSTEAVPGTEVSLSEERLSFVRCPTRGNFRGRLTIFLNRVIPTIRLI